MLHPRVLALSTTTALVWCPINAASPVLGGYVVGAGTVALAWAITRRPTASTTATGTDPHGNDTGDGGTEPPHTPTPQLPADGSAGPNESGEPPLYLDDVLAQWATTPPATTGNPWVRPHRNDR